MTYNRPTHVDLPPEYDKKATNLYSRMALYFDLYIYNDPENRDDERLYQYLYHIVYMLACKKKFFSGPNMWEYYDKFALYAATKVYTRYINHLEPELRLKSVLNYVKALLNPMRVDWQKEAFNEIIGTEEDPDEFYELQTSMEDSVKSSYCDNEELINDILLVFEHIGDVIRKIVDRTPYRKNPIMKHRLGMSILLTLVNQATLPRVILNKPGEVEYKYSLYKKDKSDKVVLWRLEDKYHNLIQILTAEVKKECSNLVGMVRNDYELSDEDVTAVLMTAYGNVARDDNEEF